jgi:hypothetical protein
MTAPRAGGERRRVQIFIVAHMVAVGVIYGVAWTLGGGHATPPFPSNDVVLARAEPARAAATPPRAGRVEAAEMPTSLPDRQEVAPPWTYGDDGRARLRER